MAHLITLLALHSFGRARLRAVLRVVALLLAVAASERVDTLFGAITSTVTFLVAVHALDSWLCRDALALLSLTVLMELAFTKGLEERTHFADVAQLTTVIAHGDTAVFNETSRSKTLHVLLG